ncbi:MAG TPA: hypothetical protein VMM76_18315 [Pirellulaceae bacterium]|nr:hypothetical protein [Pirellulaceae bacterium]
MVAKMLERRALVLNRNWQPVNVATVARALVLLWERVRASCRPNGLPALHLGGLVEVAPERRRIVYPGCAVSTASAGSDHVDRPRPTSLRGSRIQPSKHFQA